MDHRHERAAGPLTGAAATAIAPPATPTPTRSPTARTRRATAVRVGVALLVASLLVWLGPPGTDFAAHVYQRAVFLKHGFVLWDNYWYSGRYSFINYSLLYYPLAGLVGNKALAVGSFVVATLAFTLVASREWGPASRWSTLSFAVIWSAFVLTGAFPFDLGIALVLSALVAAQAHRYVICAVLTLLTAAASPLAFVLLALILLAVGLNKRVSGGAWRWIACALGAAGAVEFALFRLFPSGGSFPFSIDALAGALALCGGIALLTRGSDRARPLRWIALALAAACVASYLVPSSVGANIIRFRFAALPLVLLAVSIGRPPPRLVAVAAVALAGCWNLAPLVAGFASASRDASASPRYWRPALRFLTAHLTPSFRVEAVDSAHHWAAAYLPAAGIPVVRGWFRQDDLPQNRILYGPLTKGSYLRWLRGLGVRYVVLTDAPPDVSSGKESSLLRSGRSGLIRVFATRHLAILAVPSPRPIVTGPGPARVLELQRAGLRVRLPRSGTYRLAVHYSPYWRTSTGCLVASRSGMMRLTVKRPAVARLTFSVSLDKAADVLAGEQPERCSPATG